MTSVVERKARCLTASTWLETQEMVPFGRMGQERRFTVLLADWASASSSAKVLLGSEGLGIMSNMARTD